MICGGDARLHVSTRSTSPCREPETPERRYHTGHFTLDEEFPMAKLTQSVDLTSRGRVAVITVDNPPVNALSQHVRQGLRDGVVQAVADSAVQAIVITCAGRTFIAGADITEFGKPPA